MAVSLKKGQKVDLTKSNPGLTKILVGLGWDVNKYDGREDFDLDSSVFILGENGKVRSDSDFIFYNNLHDDVKSIVHLGDNRTGTGEGDDEQVKIELNKVPSDVQKIVFTVTIHDAIERSQNFGQVSNSYIRVLNEENGEEIIRYDLSEDYSIETSLVVGELYRHNNEWKFAAIGDGFEGGLEALCNNFGISIG